VTDKPEAGGLLQMLHQLFSRISLLDLEKRKKSFRSTGEPVDIGSRLTRHIERVAADARASGAASVHEQPTLLTRDAPSPRMTKPPAAADTGVAEVVAHFRSRASSDVSPYLGDRLESSTWSHIHTALLRARAGDLANARLHADIASQAMREAACFMSEDAYGRFARDIEQALAELERLQGPDS